MNTHHTAGAVLLTLTALLLSACNDGATSSTPEQSPPPTESSPPSSEPSSPAPSTTDGAPDYRILGPTSGAVSPGRWAVSTGGSRDVPLAVLDLPEGLYGGGQYVWSQGESPEDDGWILGYWTGGAIYLDPCTAKSGFDGDYPFPDIWVEALSAQRRTTTSQPVPVTLDGHRGIYVELTGSEDLDLGTCRQDRLTIFDTTTDDGRHVIVDSGVVDRLWLLEVDGERIVLTGQVTPETTDAQFEQLTDIVESVRFER